MAKILSVEVKSAPTVINVGDNISDIHVAVNVEFHQLDIKHEMEYCLHLFVYDIHGQVDPPMVLPNWDESKVITISLDRKDEFLGSKSQRVIADKKLVTMEAAIPLKLGRIAKGGSYFAKKLEVFATIAPAIGRASKWSDPFEAKLVH